MNMALIQKEWEKVCGSNRVLSIKGVANKFVRELDANENECISMLKDFIENNQNAVLVNDIQAIDINTLAEKAINNTSELKKILYEEYFINEFSEKHIKYIFNFVISRSSVPKKRNDNSGDYSFRSLKNFIVKHSSICSKIKQRQLKIKDLTNIIAEIIMSKNKTNNVNINDIAFYLELLGVNVSHEELIEVLEKDLLFNSISPEEWMKISNKQELKINNISNIIYLHQWLYRQYSVEGAKHLQDIIYQIILRDTNFNYRATFNINDIFFYLELIGHKPNKEAIIDIIENKLAYARLSPEEWTTDRSSKYKFIDNFGEVYAKTINIISKELKAKEITVFELRIMQNKTLEEVGKTMGVTRERIRQLEKRIYKKLRHYKYRLYIKPFHDWVWNELKVKKILKLSDFNIIYDDYDKFDFIFSLINTHIKRYGEILVNNLFFINVLKAVQNNTDQKTYIFNMNEVGVFFTKRQKGLIRELLTNYLDMPEIDEDKFIYKRTKLTKMDEVYLIIRQAGKPLHYTEINKAAEEFDLPFNIGSHTNSLAIMERNELLERVAPGTYALVEWGISKHIYIKDLVFLVLQEANMPLSFDDLYNGVQKKRFDEIKESSVYHYANIHPKIRNLGGKYYLTDWLQEEERYEQGEYLDDVIIEQALNTPDELIKLGLCYGFIDASYLEKLQELGYNPRSIIVDLEQKGIAIRW